MNSISANLNIMIKASEKASKILIRDFGEIEKLQVSKKGPTDFVTNSDLKAEKIIIEELKKAGEKVEFGDDLLDSHLRIIGDNHPGFFFLTDWPMKLKPFYIREKDEDATLSRSFDLQF